MTDSAPASPRPTRPVLPGSGINLQDADAVAELFEQAAQANLTESRRKGACIHLGPRGRLVISGDLHDNGHNFLKILTLAKLHESEHNHLIMQEVIHGKTLMNGMDMSIRTLARLAHLKTMFPEQVHILQSNHELAQMLESGILKDGLNVIDAFNEGTKSIYGEGAEKVTAAAKAFIRSYPLAVRCANGLICTHSLPNERAMKRFDPAVIDRDPTDEDLARHGSGYDLVWGRNHPQEQTAEVLEKWGGQLLIVGHQPAPMGYEMQNRSQLIITSDHEFGMTLVIDLAKKYLMDDLIVDMVPLASVDA